jgi:Leucine-rich repeat (LRR) protein
MLAIVWIAFALGVGGKADSAVAGANCTGSISTESYEALEALYNSANGYHWIWDPKQPSSTIWHFPSQFVAPCSEAWQGLICSRNLLNDTMCEIDEVFLPQRNLTGTLPSELGNLMTLLRLDLSTNLMGGEIPSELGNLVNLQGLYLDFNLLEGTIPSELGNLIKLEGLGLDSMSLDGTIPSELGNLKNLGGLFLFSNSLTGSIPSELGNIAELTTLGLYDNTLHGTIPSQLGNLVKLEGLEISVNLLDGTIPTELGHLTNLQGLVLCENSLAGTVPTEFGMFTALIIFDLSYNLLSGPLPLFIADWSSLQAANVSTNSFSGSIHMFASKNLTSLEVLDLSSNRFSGIIPNSLFSLSVLQTVILSQNCFSGSLPPSMCVNGKLEHIILDLLTGNCGAVDGGIFQGFVLDRSIKGTIPSCLWSSSSIQMLHLLGNGLDGTLSDLSNSSVLSVLALGSNQLTGTIPVTFQHHNFTQFDLSMNRLSGTLESDLTISQNATVYDLSVNRLSGKIPGAMFASYTSGVLNVLEGNVFGCQQKNIPSSDASHNSYQCGSLDFQYSLLAWATGLVFCAVGAGIVIYASNWTIEALTVCRSREFVGVLLGPISCLIICMEALFGFVATKLINKALTSTHAVQYWWTSTIVFVHSWIITLFFLLNLFAVCVVFSMTAVSLATQKDLPGRDASVLRSKLIRRIVAHFINVVVPATVNGVYVLLAIDGVNDIALLVIQAALGLFKLGWSLWMIPWLLQWARIDTSHQLSHWIFMVLFLFLGAPFALSFCESSSCFLYVLTRPPPISFSLMIPVVDFASECGGYACTFYPVLEEQLMQSSIPAPWIYSYQCSSAVITGYAPVLVMSYLASGIVIPFSRMLIASNAVSHGLRKAMSWCDCTCFNNLSATVLPDKKSISMLGKRAVVKYILNLAVMMTFGLAVPLLSIAVVCDTVFNLVTDLVLIKISVKSCQLNRLEVGTLTQEFWEHFDMSPRDIKRCAFVVFGYISVFWSLFVFDWIADVHGSMVGGLVMLVPLILPTLVGLPIMRRMTPRTVSKIRRNVTTGVEFAEIGNPLNMPFTDDTFSAK